MQAYLTLCGCQLRLEDPEVLALLGLQLRQLLTVDLPDPLGRDRLGRVDLLDLQARLVLVQVLAGEPRLSSYGQMNAWRLYAW